MGSGAALVAAATSAEVAASTPGEGAMTVPTMAHEDSSTTPIVTKP
jgi:hypothetical protein